MSKNARIPIEAMKGICNAPILVVIFSYPCYAHTHILIALFSLQLSKTTGAYRRPIMYESFFLISCSKYSIMQVTTSDRQEPQSFLSSDKESLFLPDDMDSFLFDFTSYYFIGYRNLPGRSAILDSCSQIYFFYFASISFFCQVCFSYHV